MTMPTPTISSTAPMRPAIRLIQNVRIADVMCDSNGVPASSPRFT